MTDPLAAEARRLGEGRSVDDIARQLGVAKSTAYQWVKHLPLDSDDEAAARRRARSRVMTDARWAAHREARDAAQAVEQARAAEVVGSLDERDLLLLGAAIYWCEGAKTKPWRRQDRGCSSSTAIRGCSQDGPPEHRGGLPRLSGDQCAAQSRALLADRRYDRRAVPDRGRRGPSMMGH